MYVKSERVGDNCQSRGVNKSSLWSIIQTFDLPKKKKKRKRKAVGELHVAQQAPSFDRRRNYMSAD